MKPIIRILMFTAAAVLMASCMVYRSVPTTSRVYSTGYRYIENPIEQREVLRAYYPQLFNYYEEGLLQIISMRERLYSNGHREWDIRRRYVKRYITSDREQMYILEHYYPDVFARARRGEVRINKMYGYVDNSGRIRYKVDYSRVRNPRPQPAPQPAPRYEPAPAHTPTGRPGNAPGNNVRPANPPANGSGNNVRPGNNERPGNPPANNVRPGNNDRPTNPPANGSGNNVRPGNNDRPANPPANASGSNVRRENTERPANTSGNTSTNARQGTSDRPARARTEARRETTERSANTSANTSGNSSTNARQGTNGRPANARRGGVVTNNQNEEQKVEEKKEENK